LPDSARPREGHNADGRLRLGGVPELACLAFDGVTDSAYLETYLERCQVPALRPGDILVINNLACLKTAEMARRIATAGAEVRYLLAYGPDLDPDRATLQQAQGLAPVGGAALRAVQPGDIAGWFAQNRSPIGESIGTVKGKLHQA
jgi:hypothetical protein